MRPCGVRCTKYWHTLTIMHTKMQLYLWFAFLLLLVLFPFFGGDYLISLVIFISITIISVTGLNLLVGFAGQLSIGHAAFMAVGAYASAFLVAKLGLNFFLALPLAGLAAAGVGIIFGAPSVRVKGFYLALATLAAHFIIIWALMEYFGGTQGQPSPRPEIFGFAFSSNFSYYYLVMALTVAMGLFAKNLTRSKVGRAFIAVRDNDIAAEVLGINVFGYKLLAFAVGTFYAGVAGALLAHFYSWTNIESFTLWDSIWFLGMLIIGGLGSHIGAIFGVVLMRLLQEGATILGPKLALFMPGGGFQAFSSLALIIYAAVIILFMLFEPRGLAHRWELFKASYRLIPFSY